MDTALEAQGWVLVLQDCGEQEVRAVRSACESLAMALYRLPSSAAVRCILAVPYSPLFTAASVAARWQLHAGAKPELQQRFGTRTLMNAGRLNDLSPLLQSALLNRWHESSGLPRAPRARAQVQ